MRDTYLVCYDISDPKRLRQVFKICRDHGDHLQYSVFECDLSDSEKAALEAKLAAVIAPAEDQILFVRLGPAGSRGARDITSLGTPYLKLDKPCFVV